MHQQANSTNARQFNNPKAKCNSSRWKLTEAEEKKHATLEEKHESAYWTLLGDAGDY
jgi:hypothetical protein